MLPFYRRSIIIAGILALLHLSQFTTLNAPMLAQTGKGSIPLFDKGLSGIPVTLESSLSLDDIQQIQKTVMARYGSAIKRNARDYGLDWRLIVAVMRQESRFHENAVSYAGARGLMQIMPGTETIIARKLGLKDLSQVPHNILGGTYYLAHLYDMFQSAPIEDRICLTLAAYNAGPGRVYDAQEVAAYLGENPNSWETIARMMPLLSRRNYTLHQAIWASGKPRWGYFGDCRQTVDYVSKVVTNYSGLRVAMADAGVRGGTQKGG